jgi:hypothetical protein
MKLGDQDLVGFAVLVRGIELETTLDEVMSHPVQRYRRRRLARKIARMAPQQRSSSGMMDIEAGERGGARTVHGPANVATARRRDWTTG